MINDFITREDLMFFGSGSRHTMGSALLLANREKALAPATFDLFVRDLPKCRNYLVAAGLEHIVDYLLNFKFDREQINWLAQNLKLPKATSGYLSKVRFSGDLWAIPEGTVCFPNEPIIRITAPWFEGAMIEQYLINTLMLQTMLASKVSRLVQVVGDKETGFVPVRTHGIDSAMKGARIGRMFGVTRAYSMLAARKAGETSSGGAMTTHFYILAFQSELEAFRTLANNGANHLAFMVDTYDVKRGVKNFIKVAKESAAKGIKLRALALDSGDLYKLSKMARGMLDQADLKYIKIIGMSSLDEHSINKLVKQKAPIDFYSGSTEVLNVTDAPKLEVVYKMSELLEGDKMVSRMKFSSGKLSLPGCKQVIRIKKGGRYCEDIIALDKEKLSGKRLLVPILKSGKLIKPLPSLEAIRKYYQVEIKKFQPALLSVEKSFKYTTKISPQLKQLITKTKRETRKILHDNESE